MRLRALALIPLAALLIAPACSGSDAGATGGGDSGAADPIGAPRDPAFAGGDPFGGTNVAKSASVEMDVPKDRLSGAAQAVVDLAVADTTGGFLVSSVVDIQQGFGMADVRVKVPSPSFETVVSDLEEIGHITRQELEGRALDNSFLSVNARLRRTRSQIASLLGRLDDTDDRAQRFELRSALRRARSKKASLERNRAYIEGITSYSTVDVSIEGRPPVGGPAAPPWERSLETAKSLTMSIVSGAILAAGVIVPLGGLALVIYLLVAPLVRRVRKGPWGERPEPGRG